MTLASGMLPRMGIDVGGTKIELVVLDDRGNEIERERTRTPREYGLLMQTLRELVLSVETRVGSTLNVGIGFPGSASPGTGLWRNANMTYCNGKPLESDIAHSLGREIRLENDANCFALSEALYGAGAGHDVVFAGTLGTGVGGGLVINGSLHAGINHLGGEWGHIPLPWPQAAEMPLAPCFCGLSGCAEQYISGTGLTRDYKSRGGSKSSAEEILRDHKAGEPIASRAIADLLERLARFLAVVVNIIDPDIVVLGGGLSGIEEIYRVVPDALAKWSFGSQARIKLARAKFGSASGVRGAALLWNQSHISQQ